MVGAWRTGVGEDERSASTWGCDVDDVEWFLAACHGCRALTAMIVACLHLPPRRSQESEEVVPAGWHAARQLGLSSVRALGALSWERRYVKIL